VNGLRLPFSLLQFEAGDPPAPRNVRSDPKILPFSKLAVVFDDVRGSVHSGPAGPPWPDGFQVVDRQGSPPVAAFDVSVLGRPVQNVLPVASDVEVLAVELEADGSHVATGGTGFQALKTGFSHALLFLTGAGRIVVSLLVFTALG